METLGDAVYMVAGGVPERRSNHAASVASVGLELIEKVHQMHCPCAINGPLQIRLGNYIDMCINLILQFYAEILPPQNNKNAASYNLYISLSALVALSYD